MPDDFQLRPATQNDTHVIVALVYQVLKEYGLEPAPDTTDRDLYHVEAHYLNNRGDFAVVESEGAIVATVGVAKVDEHTCELRKMYSLKRVRGRGLGKRLLEHAIDKARELGYRTMVLETAAPLKEAIGLYRKYGFREYKPPEMAARCDQAFKLEL